VRVQLEGDALVEVAQRGERGLHEDEQDDERHGEERDGHRRQRQPYTQPPIRGLITRDPAPREPI
jgi:hypothetical protein